MTHCPRCGGRLVREGSDVECQNGCDLNAPASTDDDVVLRLPVPPSANRWWRMGRSGRSGGHHMHLSADAQAYKSAVQMLAGSALRPIKGARTWPVWPHPIEVALDIRWYRTHRAGDLDKRLGVLLDALQDTLYTKDGQVVELHAFRFEVPEDERRTQPEGWVEVRAWCAKLPIVTAPVAPPRDREGEDALGTPRPPSNISSQPPAPLAR